MVKRSTVSAKKPSALARLDAGIHDDGRSVRTPEVGSFREFLETQARVRVQSGPAAGTYAPYRFAGREALVEVVGLIDWVLANQVKDVKLALAGGAQFGKTTLELNFAAYCAALRWLNPIVFLPDDQLAADIVDAKFRPDVIDQIGWFAELTKVGRSVNESGKAVNTKGAFLVTDGSHKAVGMFRGLQKPPTSFTADVVIEDEKDDIKRAMAKYVSGRMTISDLRFHLQIGTQRIHGAGQNLVWKSGSQGVVLLASKSTWDTGDIVPHLKNAYGHLYVEQVPAGFINPEEAWPQICRLAVTGTPRTDDPRLGYEGDFRRAGSDVVVGVPMPGAHYYYAHPETGEPLDLAHPLWQHRRPERLVQHDFTFRVAQIGVGAIDLAQIVTHWGRAVGDAEEMIVFRCDRQAMPKSAAQALTPEILERSRKAGSFLFGVRRTLPRFAGLDTGDRCWYTCREVANPSDKRVINAAQIAIGDVVSRVLALCASDQVSTLFIDERPAVSEARTLALALNGLAELTTWPQGVDWRSRELYLQLPSGLVWDGRQQRWLGLRCAVVRFTKNQLGAGIEQGAVEFQEEGVTKFVPMIACNRFESVDRVVREFLTPAENVVEFVVGADGKKAIRQEPALRLPLAVPGAPAILETLSSHLLVGSQRAKDDKTGELGDYIDGVDNHLLFASAYSALAETVGGTAKASTSPGFFIPVPFSRQTSRAAARSERTCSV